MIKRYLTVTRRLAPSALVTTSLLFALGTTSLAQQTTGVPGSPDATTTIDGRYRRRLRRSRATSTSTHSNRSPLGRRAWSLRRERRIFY
jgi:hypothetical protein